jgi:CubicO group peptidase (beta-lactamase class C family)
MPSILQSLCVLSFSSVLCISTARADPPANPIDPSVSPPEATANAVPPTQIDNAIAQLPELAKDILARTHIPGLAISVVRDGRTVYAAGFGVRRVGTTDAVNADTVFQIASLSKPLAGTVVAHQVGVGIVSWETPVRKHLPWFALNDPWITTHVTIGDMFAHRSGLPDHAGDELEDLGYDRDQVLRRLRFAKLHSFRDEYAYTNFGLTAAAEAVAVASHTDWATLSQQVLYGPLGMSSTSSRYADFIGRPNHAAGHVLVNGQYEAKYQRQPDAQSPAGGVSSSANDMARWMSLVLQGGMIDGKSAVAADALLPAITAQIVSSPSHVPAARAGFYGYGFNVGTLASGRVSLGHSGAFALGAATNFVMIPSLGVGITVLSNAAPIGAVEALGMDFADLVQFGVVTRDWLAGYGALMQPMSAPTGSLVGKSPPEHAAPARQPDDYAGTYHNDYFGDLAVERRGGSLVLLLGPKHTQYKLFHWNGDVFTFEPSGENANAGSISKVTFTMKAAGRADKADVEFFDDTGWGTFARRQ